MSELLPPTHKLVQRMNDTRIRLNESRSEKGATHPDTFAAFNRHEGAVLAYLEEIKRLREVEAKKATRKKS